MKAGWWAALLLPLLLASAEPTLRHPDVGVLDLAEAVDHATTRRLAEKVERLTKQPGIALLLVFERGEEDDELKSAEAWLEAWSADQPAAETAPEEPIDRAAPAPAEPAPVLPRAVLSIHLATGKTDFSGGAEIDSLWAPSERDAALSEWVTPPLAEHDLSGLVHGLVTLCESLAGVPPATEAPDPAVDEPVAAPISLPRPWLNGWLFVGLPVLFCLAILAVRQGPGTALALAIPLVLLYAGLYFLLAFQPLLLLVAGVLALAPLWLLQGSVAPRPARAAASGQPRGQGGFAQTGYGAFGSGAWSS